MVVKGHVIAQLIPPNDVDGTRVAVIADPEGHLAQDM